MGVIPINQVTKVAIVVSHGSMGNGKFVLHEIEYGRVVRLLIITCKLVHLILKPLGALPMVLIHHNRVHLDAQTSTDP